MEFPTRAGQSVRSALDGTLGVTTSPRLHSGLIKVMLIGSVVQATFKASDLIVTTLAETE